MSSASQPIGVIAKLLDLSERRVQQLSREGVIPKAERGQYDLIGSVRGYVRYAAKSGKPEAEIAILMAKETWLDAAEALEMGFADTLSGPVKIAASFDVSRFRNAPPEIIEAVKAVAKPAVVAPEPDPSPAPVAKVDAVPDPVPDPTPDLAPDPDPDPVAVRAEVMAYARTVVDLCRLAGQLQMAAAFLTAETSLDSIRKALIDAKAANEPDISSTHPQPGPAPEAKPWGDVIARTFKRKG